MSEERAQAPVKERPWQSYAVLVVDDEPGMVSFLSRALEERCGEVATAGSVEEAEKLLAHRHFDLIILDISLPGKSGVVWLHELRARGFSGDVVLMTAFADVETAIDALRGGASDFLLKPFTLAQALNAVKRCFERSHLMRENYVLRRRVADEGAFEALVGKSREMAAIRGLLQRIAPMPTTVLILGESGTGKEVAARALHQASARSSGPFVPVNCAAISAELIESELFGHVRGAYTGATAGREGLFYYARGGTLFLDEISELAYPMQAKLLRVLEERRLRPVGSEQEIPVDVRVVAASNKDLSAEVSAGRFRADLFYRLQVVELTMSPLRERPEDIADLVRHFADRIAPQLGVPTLAPDERALRCMQAYDWPGNVRELRNLVERSLILGYFPDNWGCSVAGATAATTGDPDESLASVEERHIRAVLAAVDGNKSEAARRRGVSRKTLERKCFAWGL
ncbi:MAG: sigma-54-dependent Fis family transcriptional regulator [Rhodocyclaceae bacterium]|nr:sigma-54-dependent Fis family transcriptional regulator [Rhodocyclaceae bacterium]